MEWLLIALKYVSFTITAVTGYIGTRFETSEKSNDPNKPKQLTKFGRWNLRFLLISVVIGLALQVGEDVKEQRDSDSKDFKERKKQTELLKEIRRGVYPLAGLRLSVTLELLPTEEERAFFQKNRVWLGHQMRSTPEFHARLSRFEYMYPELCFGAKSYDKSVGEVWPTTIQGDVTLKYIIRNQKDGDRTFGALLRLNDRDLLELSMEQEAYVRGNGISSLADLEGRPVEIHVTFKSEKVAREVIAVRVTARSAAGQEHSFWAHQGEFTIASISTSSGAAQIRFAEVFPPLDQWKS